MASFLDKFKINTAVTKNTKLDLSCQHITTSTWMEFQPVYNKEMVPGESIKINQETFLRLSPLPVPTFGRANVHNRAFFVPFRTVFKGWDDFITDAVHVNSVYESTQLNKVPHFYMRDLFDLMMDDKYTQTVTGADVTAGRYDLVNYVGDGTGNHEYYKFTKRGRAMLKILQSLGYQVSFNPHTLSDGTYQQYCYSALPLLSILRVYVDWYFPSAYVGDGNYSNIMKLLVCDSANSDSGLTLSASDLSLIFDNLYKVNYDSDYFVSAFDNPVGPTSRSSVLPWTSQSIMDITTADPDDRVQTNSNGTPTINYVSQGSNSTGISQYAIDALKAMTDYAKRHQLVGARALDRFYARFGKALPAEKLNRSNYVGAFNVPVQFGDVYSSASTDGAALGDFAGKGLGYDNTTFEYTTNDYGMMIIISSIVPTVGYYNGIDRNVMHLSKLDYWTPEFDQLGNQAISKGELYMPMFTTSAIGSGGSDSDSANSIFGWTPRYSEYKVGHDRLTGDFRIHSYRNSGTVSNAWYLDRSFDDGVFSTWSQVVHGSSFIQGEDSDQFNRIFTYAGDMDGFYVIHNFNVISNSPMHSLYDTYEFEDKGQSVVGDVNGVKVN